MTENGIAKFSDCELEVDLNRGVIYVHSSTGNTYLRICRIPKEKLPRKMNESLYQIPFLDITIVEAKVSYNE